MSKETKKRTYVTVTAGFEYWKPTKKGDSVEGTFLEIMERENRLAKKKGEMQKQVVLVDANNQQIMLPSHFGITGAVEKGGAGYYKITVVEMGGKKIKGQAFASPYKYNVQHSKN